MDAGRRRDWSRLAAAFAVLATAGIGALTANAGSAGEQQIRVSYSGFNAERVKTIPIAKTSGRKPRVAMSLPPTKVGPIRRDSGVWAGAEIEVSVTCLEPMPQCVGRIYHYSPRIRAQLVLAGGPRAAGANNTTPISKPRVLQCSQDLPNRNHHCVLTVEGFRLLEREGEAGCARCHVNLVLSAFHPQAKNGQVVVVGADAEREIAQNKGMLNAAVFDPGPKPAANRARSRRPSRRKVGVGGQGGQGPKQVIYSRRLGELRAGEQLVVRAKAVQKIKHLDYNVLMQSQLVLSEKPGSVSRRGNPGKIASLDGVIAAQNGFNCTQGASGHSDPCVIRKLGVVRIFKDSRTRPEQGEGAFVPLYVNLVVQNREISAGRGSRHRPGDAAKIARKAGFLEIERYGPEFRR